MAEANLPQQILESARLRLEPLTLSHAWVVYEHLLDQRLYQFIPCDPPLSLQALENRYSALSSRVSPNEQETWLNWAMRLHTTDTYVGLLEAMLEARTAKLAYLTFPSFWRQGYAKEGCHCLLTHLFNDWGITSITADVDTRNVASIQLLKTFGFERIATRTNADFFKGSASHEYQYRLQKSA